LPQSHFRFFRDLQNSFSSGDFFFAHAGAKPNVELARQKESDLLWIRGEFLSSSCDFGQIVVHGHTPGVEVEVRANRINIDTGAFATGRLTCLVIDGESLSTIDTVAEP
jgi:serine/threonine protein phosphatase 1